MKRSLPDAITASGESSIAAGAGSFVATDGSIAAQVVAQSGTQTRLEAQAPADGHGASVTISTTFLPKVRRARGGPPNRPARVFGRDPVLRALEAAVAGAVPTVVAGAQGAGKSTIVDAVLNGPAAAATADGIVQIPGALGGAALHPDEIAQRLHDALWDTGENRSRVDVVSARAELADCHPLLAIDGPQLSVDEQRVLASLIPNSPVLITSDTIPFGGGEFIGLDGLPPPDAVRLLAERSGLAASRNRALLGRATDLLQGWPGAIATLADLIKAGRVTLKRAVASMDEATVTQSVVPAAAYERLLAVLDDVLSVSEAALLESVAGLAGTSVREDLAVIAAPGASANTAATLVASGVAWHASPRLRIDAGLRAAILRDPTRQVARSAPTTLASEPGRILGPDGYLDPLDVPVALGALDGAAHDGDHGAVRTLARALDPWLMANGLWNLWSHVLDRAGEAADGSRNEADRAWVMHEQGTRALLVGEYDRARGLLQQALEIRRRADVAAVGRTEQNLDVVRMVTAPPSSPWQGLGPRGQLLLTSAALVTVIGALIWFGGIADAVRGYLAPTPTQAAPTASPTPVATPTPGATATPEPRATVVVPPLGLQTTFETTDLLPTGDWSGVATVTPTGGTPPYRFVINAETRDGSETEVFPVSGSACAPALVAGSISDAADRSIEVNESFAPDRCEGYLKPGPPRPGRPADGTTVFSNCATTTLAFRWSPSRSDSGATSLFELERWDGAATWEPLAAQSDLKVPRTTAEAPCDSRLRWRAATLSSDGWVSDWSDWSTLTIQPTAVPRLADAPKLKVCAFTIDLSWAVERADGIGTYRIDLVELSRVTPPPTSQTTDATSFAMPVPTCDREYQWTVTAIDVDGNPGPPSDAGFFYMPPAAIGLSDAPDLRRHHHG